MFIETNNLFTIYFKVIYLLAKVNKCFHQEYLSSSFKNLEKLYLE